MAVGYHGPLFMLAFDHRGARHLPMFGVDGDQDADQRSRISAVKHFVHDGFELAREAAGLGPEAGILVDEEFGADIARRASFEGVTVAMPVEVSGLDHFAFEYGEQFGAHLDDFDRANDVAVRDRRLPGRLVAIRAAAAARIATNYRRCIDAYTA